jgi:hypothetical protein
MVNNDSGAVFDDLGNDTDEDPLLNFAHLSMITISK